MTSLIGTLYRLRDPVTGAMLHFTCLDRTTYDERQAWVGTGKMVDGVRKAHPHTRKFRAIPHEKPRRVFR